MSQTLAVEVDDQVYEAIRAKAEAAGTSPAQIAGAALQKEFNGKHKAADARAGWPEGFFDKIHIDDPTFKRPDQGPMPPAPVLG